MFERVGERGGGREVMGEVERVSEGKCQKGVSDGWQRGGEGRAGWGIHLDARMGEAYCRE